MGLEKVLPQIRRATVRKLARFSGTVKRSDAGHWVALATASYVPLRDTWRGYCFRYGWLQIRRVDFMIATIGGIIGLAVKIAADSLLMPLLAQKTELSQLAEMVIPQGLWRAATALTIGIIYTFGAAAWALHAVVARAMDAVAGPRAVYLGFRSFVIPVASIALHAALIILIAVLAALAFASHGIEPNPGIAALDYLVDNYPFAFVAAAAIWLLLRDRAERVRNQDQAYIYGSKRRALLAAGIGLAAFLGVTLSPRAFLSNHGPARQVATTVATEPQPAKTSGRLNDQP